MEKVWKGAKLDYYYFAEITNVISRMFERIFSLMLYFNEL